MVDCDVGRKASSSLRGTGLRLIVVPGEIGVALLVSLVLGERGVVASARIEVASADSIVGADDMRPR